MLNVPFFIDLKKVKKLENTRQFYNLRSVVKTTKGDKNLADIEVGDVLIGDKGRQNTVKGVSEFQPMPYYLMINETLRVHPHQSIMQVGDIAIHAKDLKVGDWLLLEQGAVQVETIHRIHDPFPLVRLSLDGDHTYFINGILVHNADRYWVNLTATTWNGTAGSKWSTTSGGGGGSSVPTASDNAIFDGNSGTAICTVGASRVCLDWNVSAFGGTFAGSGAVTVSGSLTWSSTVAGTWTGNITFDGSGSHTVTHNGATTARTYTFNGTGTWTIQDTWNNGTDTITLTAGTLDTNDQTITCGTFQSNNSNTRTLDLGASVINCTSWNISTVTNLTLIEGTSSIRVTGTGSFQTGTETYYEIQQNGTTQSTSGSVFTCTNLIWTGTAAKTNTRKLGANVTVTGTFTIAGNSSVNRMYFGSTVRGETRTVTAAAIAFSNVDIEDITGAGAANWDISAISGLSGDCGGNSGMTLTSPLTLYWHVDAGSYSDSAKWFLATNGGGGAGRVPLPQDTARWDANSMDSGAQTVTVDMVRLANIDTTGIDNTPTFDLTLNASYYGDLILEGLTVSSTALQTYAGRGTHVIDTNGIAIDKQMSVDCVDGSYTLLSAYVGGSSRSFGVDSGTFDTDGFSMTVGSFGGTGTSTRSISLGASVITLQSTGTIYDYLTVTGLTFNAGTSEIRTTSTSAATRLFRMGGLTHHIFTYAGTATQALQFSGGGGIYDLRSENIDHTFHFTASTTTTMIEVWTVWTTGSCTFAGLTSAAYSISAGFSGAAQGSGSLSVTYMTAVQDNTFYAGAGSTDGGNNVRVYFEDAPEGVDIRLFGMMMMDG